ncbi:MAG: dihydrofolate reductase [Alphaproteobacteria bacterium]|nr:dihydrofolate reductase [Alphaproteobacteria bacterium]
MKNKTTVCGIVAIGPDDVIGQNGVMPWYSRRDFYHFKKLTTPYPCVFGKTTFMNLPVRPLPNRLNIVCSSSNQDEFKNGVFYAKSFESAINAGWGAQYLFVCGGTKIYKYALDQDIVDIMYITRIYDENLAKDISQNPDKYVRFPAGTGVFFDSDKWATKRINYTNGNLPQDLPNIQTAFFKCVRLR